VANGIARRDIQGVLTLKNYHEMLIRIKTEEKRLPQTLSKSPKVRPFRENRLKKGTVSYYYFNGWQRLIIHIACTQPSELIT